ncbi:ABC transporter ATP-binding protein [Ancylobacter sonchi]|uniref:ABC transporter ATP-binding protein n=1 Tax=Ancylobacter sonchi TaxID=1937790 RepID=UPI001BD4360E|nr:ABC transporter ATP-binding protein [Ancylobacter sonchi]MBS7533991.1 ABC transporter ATP-binding protein [Ancylobacter sonchi]
MTVLDPTPLIDIRDLRVTFNTPRGPAEAICGVDLSLKPGEVLGIVGESGSGKSVAMMALMHLLPPSATITGSVTFHGRELVGAPRAEMDRLRGAKIGMIFQDPLTAFNPVLTVGAQIVEALRLHDAALSKRAAWDRAVELLAEVAIPQPDRRAAQYPHEFSGGMRQRAMIAMAIANRPELLIADEPTTALDVTVQAQIMDVLHKLREERGIGLILITHDLGVVAGAADRIAVMYSGRIVEQGTVDDVFYASRHPYTRGLIAALPRLDGGDGPLTAIEGTPPSLFNRPRGCAFRPRCPVALAPCGEDVPPLRRAGVVESACWRAADLAEVPV